MVSVKYKFMDKTMALGIHSIRRKVAQQEKIGFVQGWFILEIVVLAWESLEWARETGQQTHFLKIDFHKAYDQVDWTFVTKMLTCL